MKRILAALCAAVICTAFTFNVPESVTAVSKPARVAGISVCQSGQSCHTVSWAKAKRANGYELYVNGVPSVRTKARVYKVTGLKSSATYSYKVRAYRTYTKKVWMNKMTGKWQTKKPKKKYRGKSRKEVRYVYGAFSNTKSLAAPQVSQPAKEEADKPAAGQPVSDTKEKKDIAVQYRDWEQFTGKLILYEGVLGESYNENRRLSEGEDYLYTPGTEGNGWTARYTGIGNYKGSFELPDYRSCYQHEKNEIISSTAGMTDMQKMSYLMDYIDAYTYEKYSDGNTEPGYCGIKVFYKRCGGCESYAEFISMMCVELGIKDHFTVVDNSIPHSYNIVGLDGRWYVIDASTSEKKFSCSDWGYMGCFAYIQSDSIKAGAYPQVWEDTECMKSPGSYLYHYEKSGDSYTREICAFDLSDGENTFASSDTSVLDMKSGGNCLTRYLNGKGTAELSVILKNTRDGNEYPISMKASITLQ